MPPLAIDDEGVLVDLIDRGIIPAKYECVFAAGSIVRGWGNDGSDLDIYVVSPEPYDGEVDRLIQGSVVPPTVPLRTTFARQRRVDVEYWLVDQVDQLLDRVGAARMDGERPAAEDFTNREIEFMGRLLHALPLAGAESLDHRRDDFTASALRPIMAGRFLDLYDNAVEDAVGQLNAGDLDSAVLATSRAFGFAVDALLCDHGEISFSAKWRARRMRAIDSEVLPFAEYWRLETMQGFDPADPERWVATVLPVCQRIAMEVPVR